MKYFILYTFKSDKATGCGNITKIFNKKMSEEEIIENLKKDYNYTEVRLIEAIKISEGEK